MRLTLIRNATLVMDYGKRRFLFDPYFAPRFSLRSFTGRSQNPMVDLPFSHEQILDGVEIVLISHLHTDHFDAIAQEAIPKSLPIYCQPGDEETIRSKGFSDVTPIADHLTWNGISIARTEGHHGREAIEGLMGKVSGWVLSADDEPTLYWAGDTVLCDEVRSAIQLYAPDIMITHSSGAMWNDPTHEGQRGLIVMDAAQTIETAALLPPSSCLIAHHMEALDHGTVTRADLRQAANEAGLSPERLRIPADGETLNLAVIGS